MRCCLLTCGIRYSHACHGEMDMCACVLMCVHVLLFVRDWFTKPSSELDIVRAELTVERERRIATEERLKESERQRVALKRERDALLVSCYHFGLSHLLLL